MFKPLLKVLPCLSGNMKLSCYTSDVEKIDSKTYTCKVNSANLASISHDMYDDNIKINLKNNSFEYDVKEFYKHYFDVFFDNNFRYSKVNCPIIDLTQPVYDTNKDFEYGCKRVSYKKSGYPLAFFAPIYADDVKSLSGKTLVIRCEFEFGTEITNTTKYLKIPISKMSVNGSHSLLSEYLERYFSKIDDKVIYCSNSYKNIYYGIDLLHGGLTRVEDNVSANIYRKYWTINKFDFLLNDGFKRNQMMMRQAIALSFFFDPSLMLDKVEKNLYSFAKMKISAKWHDDVANRDLSFYDFSDDYSSFSEDMLVMDGMNSFKYENTGMNIMDIPYPAFNESSSENYKYANTITKKYCRWKLKYSDDVHPYITNANYAFSANQGSLYMYKEFPMMYSPMYSKCNLVGPSQKYNLQFDFEDIYNSHTGNLINDKEAYRGMYDYNHIGTFFNIVMEKDLTKIFNDDSLWSDVTRDGKLYSNGILYDLNKIYFNDESVGSKIDKFSLIVVPKFKYYNVSEFRDTFKKSSMIVDFSGKDTSSESGMFSYQSLSTCSSTTQNDTKFIIDSNGNYISVYYDDMFNLPKSPSDGHLLNQYYDLNDLYVACYLIDPSKNIRAIVNSRAIETIDAMKVLPISNARNIYSELIKETPSLYNCINVFNDSGHVWRQKRLLEIEDFMWSSQRVFFSIYPNKTAYSLVDYCKMVENREDSEITIYMKTKMIRVEDAKKILEEVFSDYWITSPGVPFDLNYLDLDKWAYIDGLYDKENNIKYTDPCFVLVDNKKKSSHGNWIDGDNDIIFVDPYNLERVYVKYLHKKMPRVLASKMKKAKMKCKFLDNMHLSMYFDKLYKDETLAHIGTEDVIDNIFIKARVFSNVIIQLDEEDFNTLVAKDEYFKISDYGLKTVQDIFKYLDYEPKYNGYWRFNEAYYADILDSEEGDGTFKADGSDESSAKPKKVPMFITSFELCFEKDMCILNTDLYNLILGKNDDVYKDLYLYHTEDSRDILHEMVFETFNISEEDGQFKKILLNFKSITQTSYDKNLVGSQDSSTSTSGAIDTSSGGESNLKEDLTITVGFVNKLLKNCSQEHCLMPYFNYIYDEEKPMTKIYNDLFIDNITTIKSSGRIEFAINEGNPKTISEITTSGDLAGIQQSDITCSSASTLSPHIEYPPSDTSQQYIYYYNTYLYKYGSDDVDMMVWIDNYTTEEANEYNSHLDGAITTKTVKVEGVEHRDPIYYSMDEVRAYNFQLPGSVGTNDFNDDTQEFYTQEEADAHNAQLPGAISTNDVKVEGVDAVDPIYYTQEEANAHNSMLGGAVSTDDLKVPSDYRMKVTRYSLANDIDDKLITYSKFIELIGNANSSSNASWLDGIEVVGEGLSGMVMATYNGKTFGFYAIETSFDNTCNTLSLMNEEFEKINAVEYINGVSAEEIERQQIDDSSNVGASIDHTSYLETMYRNILPYIYSSNIVKSALNFVGAIIHPNEYNFKNKFIQLPNQDKGISYSYTIYVNKTENDIELVRYFDSIVPYIPEKQYINAYYLYYKNTDKMIENDLAIMKTSYVMYNETSSLSNYTKVSYYDANCNVGKATPTEHKYFNDNVFYNLDKEISIKMKNTTHDNNLYTYDELVSLENDKDYLFETFKKRMSYLRLDEVSMLFLFKKYQIDFIHKFVSVYDYSYERRMKNTIDRTIPNYSRMYELTLKLNLL